MVKGIKDKDLSFQKYVLAQKCVLTSIVVGVSIYGMLFFAKTFGLQLLSGTTNQVWSRIALLFLPALFTVWIIVWALLKNSYVENFMFFTIFEKVKYKYKNKSEVQLFFESIFSLVCFVLIIVLATSYALYESKLMFSIGLLVGAILLTIGEVKRLNESNKIIFILGTWSLLIVFTVLWIVCHLIFDVAKDKCDLNIESVRAIRYFEFLEALIFGAFISFVCIRLRKILLIKND